MAQQDFHGEESSNRRWHFHALQVQPAVLVECFLVAALVALIAGRSCVGSYIYHALCGRSHFANATRPWSKQ